MKVSYSQIETWLRCRQRWFYQYCEKLEPLEVRIPLTVGRLVHQSLADFYSRRPEQRSIDLLLQSLSCYTQEYYSPDLDVESEARLNLCAERAAGLLTFFWNRYGEDEEIEQAETEFHVTTELDLAGRKVEFECIVDALASVKGKGFWLMETKTGNPDIESLVFDSFQTPLYIWVLRENGLNVKGALFNLLPENSPPDRIFFDSNYLESSFLTDFRKAVRDFPGAIYRHRSFMCRGCDYRHLCRAEAEGMDVEYVKETMYRKAERRPNERG